MGQIRKHIKQWHRLRNNNQKYHLILVDIILVRGSQQRRVQQQVRIRHHRIHKGHHQILTHNLTRVQHTEDNRMHMVGQLHKDTRHTTQHQAMGHQGSRDHTRYPLTCMRM